MVMQELLCACRITFLFRDLIFATVSMTVNMNIKEKEVFLLMWVKAWLFILALIILTFYLYYFIQIIRGRPEKFEEMLMEGLALTDIEGPEKTARLSVYIVVGLSFILEGGYFILSLISINIIYYRLLTGLFIVFEFWHGFKMIPLIQGITGHREWGPELLNWKIERMSTRFFVIHILITLGLVLTT